MDYNNNNKFSFNNNNYPNSNLNNTFQNNNYTTKNVNQDDTTPFKPNLKLYFNSGIRNANNRSPM